MRFTQSLPLAGQGLYRTAYPDRSGFKTPSKAQWLRCPADRNADVQSGTLRIRSAGRLTLEPDLEF